MILAGSLERTGRATTQFNVYCKCETALTGRNTDIALIQNNAVVGSQIALELHKLREIKAYGEPQTVRNL